MENCYTMRSYSTGGLPPQKGDSIIQTITEEQLVGSLYGSCITYDRLYGLTKSIFGNCQDTKLDIYLDLYSIIKSVYNNTVVSMHDSGNNNAIVSTILNICAHYRHFYQSSGVSTNIYIVFGSNDAFINTTARSFDIMFDYKRYNMPTDSTHMYINSQLTALSQLISYTPDIYFIRTIYEGAPSILATMNLVNSSNHSIIITKNPYNFLIPTQPRGNGKKVVVFRPKKYKGQDSSYYVDHTNALSSLINNNNTSKQQLPQYIEDYRKCIYFLTTNGLKSRYIRGRVNCAQAVSFLNRLDAENVDITNVSATLNTIHKYEKELLSRKGPKDKIDNITQRYYMMDIFAAANNIINNISEAYFRNCLNINRNINPSFIIHLNNMKFTKFPLEIGKLLRND